MVFSAQAPITIHYGRNDFMFKYIKILLVLLLYFYLILYTKNSAKEFSVYLASALFFLSITFSLAYNNKHRTNIFLIIALLNISMIFALTIHFISGISMFFICSLALFIYSYLSPIKKIYNITTVFKPFLLTRKLPVVQK